ncbi:MAG: hypothetical protein GY754_07320, partial [bacterium]|nr:hypothetical protein [bacterium]
QDREFVMEAYKLIFDSPLRTFSEFVPIRDRFTAQVRLFIETAIENGEVPEHPFGSFILNLYWDYSGLMTLFWFNDDSEGFSNTSSLIDMSLDIIVEVLKSGLIPKSMDIFSFLFRSYMFNSMDSLKKLFSIKDAFKDGFGDLKSNG